MAPVNMAIRLVEAAQVALADDEVDFLALTQTAPVRSTSAQSVLATFLATTMLVFMPSVPAGSSLRRRRVGAVYPVAEQATAVAPSNFGES